MEGGGGEHIKYEITGRELMKEEVKKYRGWKY